MKRRWALVKSSCLCTISQPQVLSTYQKPHVLTSSSPSTLHFPCSPPRLTSLCRKLLLFSYVVPQHTSTSDKLWFFVRLWFISSFVYDVGLSEAVAVASSSHWDKKINNTILPQCLYALEAFKNNLLFLNPFQYNKQFHFSIPRGHTAKSFKVQKESSRVKKQFHKQSQYWVYPLFNLCYNSIYWAACQRPLAEQCSDRFYYYLLLY